MLLGPEVKANNIVYWDPNGTSTAGSGTWNSTTAQWSTSSSLSSSLVVWNTTNAACFCAGSSSPGAITITVSTIITNQGIFNGSLNPPGCTLTINGSGSGALYFPGTNALSGGRNAMDTSGSDGDPTIINAAIIGPGGMVIEGGDQLYLNGTNTYTGGTYLGYPANAFGSVVNITNGSAFGTGPITITNAAGCALVVEGTNSITLPNAFIAGSTAANTMNIVGPTNGVILTGPWTVGANTVALGSGNTVSNLVVIAGPISGSGGFVKYNVGLMQLAATNPFTGYVAVTNGTLALAANGSINNAASLRILPNGNGATFDVSATNAYVLPSATTLIAGGNTTTATINGAAGGTVSLGSQPVILLFDGGDPSLTIPQGTLVLNNNDLTVSNATASPLGVGTYTLIQVASGLITGAPNELVVVSGQGIQAGCVAYTQVGSGNVSLVVAQSFNLPEWNGADYSNNSHWSDGANWVSGTAPAAGDAVTFDGNTGPMPVVDYTNFLYSLTFDGTAGAYTLTNTNSAFLAVSAGVTNASANTQTFNLPVDLDNSMVQWALTSPVIVNGPISDDGNGMAVSGAGSLTLSATNPYTGPTSIGSGSTVTVTGAGSLGSGSYPGTLSVPGTAIFNYDSSATQTLSGAISGAGTISLGGTGPVTLSGVSSYTGSILLSSGSVLTIGGAGVLGSGTYADNLALPASASFTYDSTASQTMSGVISGPGALTVAAGTLTLSGLNTFTSGVMISGGTLKIGGAGDLGDLGGGSGGNYSAAITDNGTLNYDSTATQILSGVISGAGKVAASAGILTLTNASGNTYSGVTTVGGGILNVNAISDSGVSDIGTNGVTLGGGTLNYNGAAPVTTTRQFTGTTATTTIINTPVAMTLNGRVTGGGTFDVTFNGPGTLTLGNTNDNSYLGMNINGTVILNTTSASGVHGLGTATTINSGGTLQLSGSGGYDIYSGVPLTNNGGVFDLNGQNLQSAGIAALSLSGTGTGSGAMINGQAGTTSTLSLNNNTVVLAGNTMIGGPGNITIIGRALSGGYTLTYGGTGTLTIANGNNTNTGSISVSSGTLALGQNGATHGSFYSATASVDVKSGATLGCAATNGICSIAGATTLESGASALFTAMGGNVGTNGQIVVSNNLAWNTTTPVIINVAGTAPLWAGTYKLVSCTGTLSGTPPNDVAPTITGTALLPGTTATINSTTGANGSVVLTVAVNVNLSPTNIVSSVTNNQVLLAWPSDHTGWQLQVQTNNPVLVAGSYVFTNAWMTVPASTATNQVFVPPSTDGQHAFFRLYYPVP
jgi:autotransporter-associated beta strand protein